MKETNLFLKKLYNEFNAISNIDRGCFSAITECIEYETLESLQYYSHVDEFAKKLSFVCKGVLRIFHLDEEGNEWNKHFFTENSILAASSDHTAKSTIAIQALTPVELLSIPIDQFLSLSMKYKQIEAFISKLLSKVLEREKERGLMLMSYTGPKKYEHFSRTFPELENRIQHYHIASYLGITPTQLSRIRRKISHHQQM